MKRIDRVAALFSSVGFDFNKQEFDHRLIAQKLVFLAQELGIHIGYEGKYHFYLRGTYCRELTSELFAPPEKPVPIKLDESKLVSFKHMATKTQLRPHLLEVMAAYRFLRQNGRSPLECQLEIRAKKPFISPKDLALGVTICKSFWPEVTDADIESLRTEMSPWERETNRGGL